MSRKAAELLIDLAQNPQKLAEFKRDPHTVMESSGLAGEDREILGSCDLRRVRELFGPGDMGWIIENGWYGPDPGPHPTPGPDPGPPPGPEPGPGPEPPPGKEEGETRAGKPGSLSVVGSGHRLGTQMSPEALAAIRDCERLFYLVPDHGTALWIESLKASAESLQSSYVEGRPRMETYAEMVERILAPVRQGLRVCVVFYGHPGFFVLPGHEAVRQARREGYEAKMLPGISAVDCLFADLGVDPGTNGCQIFEATDFLIRRRHFDATSALVLLQIGGIAAKVFHRYAPCNVVGLQVLAEVLQERYPAGHEVILYEASAFPICGPMIERVALESLPEARVSPASTLFVPRAERPPVDPAILERLGFPGR